MQPRHLCCSHALLIQHDENQAFHHWQTTMSSGVQAFVQCRMEDAKNYLNAALEIAMLRFTCASNQCFGASQLIKPSEFLCEIYLCEENARSAALILNAVQEVISAREVNCRNDEEKALQTIQLKIQNKNSVDKQRKIHSYGFAHTSTCVH